MTYSPPSVPVPRLVANLGPWSLLSPPNATSTPASGTWESADRSVWFPIIVPTVCVARRMYWANGVTVSASYNVEAGLYLDAGYQPDAKLITTGSVAQGTASEVQFADITDTVLGPGRYWLHMSCSSASATFFRSTIASNTTDELFKCYQASVGPGSAPATATPLKGVSQNAYLFGFATTASP